MVRLTATEVSRRFSDVLNRVAAGEEIEITRAGVPTAVIAPPKARLISAERFRALLATAPPVDADFAEELRALRRSIGVRGLRVLAPDRNRGDT
ncbi:MAG TPA: type II toxin-antitoxin system prevent-host-death family antitoxin [Gaiellaceae bacterium]|nr:type II toxin-antitoxin system prevent-host-death family antitoxin [Gaiellaceae bacterium]